MHRSIVRTTHVRPEGQEYRLKATFTFSCNYVHSSVFSLVSHLMLGMYLGDICRIGPLRCLDRRRLHLRGVKERVAVSTYDQIDVLNLLRDFNIQFVTRVAQGDQDVNVWNKGKRFTQ